ncbi:MAG: hypothetical protein FWF03_01525 [Defluviitaleaceae bacterium]|nr:hypothetical protein [Defluviitaleaceae bacterium]
MTSVERVKRLFAHKKPDRIGLSESFWGDTHRKWVENGDLAENESIAERFGYDTSGAGGVNLVVDIDYEPETVAEDEDTVTKKSGNGAIFRYHKKHASTPEHIGFAVTCRREWEEFAKPRLVFDKRRINFGQYRDQKKYCADRSLFFNWSSLCVFELLKDLCGHEHMLIGMAEDPGWILEMSMTYADLMVSHAEELFAAEGRPDGFFIYEDMGFKERPFMSPAMHRELLLPAHKKLIDFAHSLGAPMMVHSCGFVEPLLPALVEAGLDGLQAMEIKAGMDLLRIYRNYGDKLALMGGIDIRALETNDKAVIDRELESKIPAVKEGFAYFLHSDHSISSAVKFDTYSYFVEKGLALGTY